MARSEGQTLANGRGYWPRTLPATSAEMLTLFWKVCCSSLVCAVAKQPNNPNPKSLDKGKQCPHKNHRDAHASISHQRPKGKTTQISTNAPGSPNTSSYPKDGILTSHRKKRSTYMYAPTWLALDYYTKCEVTIVK